MTAEELGDLRIAIAEGQAATQRLGEAIYRAADVIAERLAEAGLSAGDELQEGYILVESHDGQLMLARYDDFPNGSDRPVHMSIRDGGMPGLLPEDGETTHRARKYVVHLAGVDLISGLLSSAVESALDEHVRNASERAANIEVIIAQLQSLNPKELAADKYGLIEIDYDEFHPYNYRGVRTSAVGMVRRYETGDVVADFKAAQHDLRRAGFTPHVGNDVFGYIADGIDYELDEETACIRRGTEEERARRIQSNLEVIAELRESGDDCADREEWLNRMLAGPYAVGTDVEERSKAAHNLLGTDAR